MSNFVKISQTQTETQQSQAVALQAQRDQAAKASQKKTGDPVFNLVERVQNIAGIKGTAAERIEREIFDRDALTRLMLTEIDEVTMAKYFNDFLFGLNISTPKTFEMFNTAVRGSRLPLVELKDGLDFAYNHYNQHANVQLTLSIMNQVNDIQPSLPELQLYKILNKALQGQSSPFTFLSLSEKNLESYKLIKSLFALALAKPGERVTNMFVEFRKNKDRLERKREIDDRYKAIFSAIQEDEFTRAMQRTVTLLTQFFGWSTQEPLLNIIRKIFYALKMGQEARTQFFSEITESPISKQKPKDTQTDFFTKSNLELSNTRIAQIQSNDIKIKPIEPNVRKVLINYLDALIQFIKKLIRTLKDQKAIDKVRLPQHIQILKTYVAELGSTVNQLTELKNKVAMNTI